MLICKTNDVMCMCITVSVEVSSVSLQSDNANYWPGSIMQHFLLLSRIYVNGDRFHNIVVFMCRKKKNAKEKLHHCALSCKGNLT